MLTRIADGVLVRESATLQSNAVVVEGGSGVLLVDPGLTEAELAGLAVELRERGRPVAAGFSTHPDWDHVLWHPDLGDAPRFATAAAADAMREFLTQADWREQLVDALPPEIADEVPRHLLGLLEGLPPGADRVPWAGPTARILEHRAHAVGHAALLLEDRGVLIAGDMLSDVLVPMPDLQGDAVDPLGEYLAALELLERAVGAAPITVVPGHGSVTDAAGLRERIDRDRAYIEALRDGREPADPRIGPDAAPGWEWVAAIYEHQAGHLRR